MLKLVANFDLPDSINQMMAEVWRSQSQPLEIFAENLNTALSPNPDVEKATVIEFMRKLMPHLDRLRSLKFMPEFSSALPSFPLDFYGATSLKELELLAVTHDQYIANTAFSFQLMPGPGFVFTKLQTLAITGRVCYMLSRDIRWTDMIPRVTDLTISQFTPLPGESFTLHDLMMPILRMPALRYLDLCNLNLNISHVPSIEPRRYRLTLQEMEDFSVSAAIVRFLKPDVFKISNSSAGAYYGGLDFPYEGQLYLRLDDDEDPVPLLASWKGNHLNVDYCRGFTDFILNAMCSLDDSGNFVCAPRMTNLAISADYLRCSIDALKRLVEVRSRSGATKLRCLKIEVNTNAPGLSEEDKSFFVGMLDKFVFSQSDVYAGAP